MKEKFVTRKMLADQMLLIYREKVSRDLHHGLCSCYIGACRILFGVRLSPHLLHLLPAFVPPSYLSWGCYWWQQNDVEPRINFCEFLCELYKDDDTNLVPIVAGYLDLVLREDRIVYAKKYLESYEKNIPFNPLKHGNEEERNS